MKEIAKSEYLKHNYLEGEVSLLSHEEGRPRELSLQLAAARDFCQRASCILTASGVRDAGTSVCITLAVNVVRSLPSKELVFMLGGTRAAGFSGRRCCQDTGPLDRQYQQEIILSCVHLR
jgi:hypothetical protein